MKVRVTRNPERYGCKSINKAFAEAKEQVDAEMKGSEGKGFVLDAINIEILYIGEDYDRDIVSAYAGIEANAKLGKNLIRVYIPASAMDILQTTWKITEGYKKTDLY